MDQLQFPKEDPEVEAESGWFSSWLNEVGNFVVGEEEEGFQIMVADTFQDQLVVVETPKGAAHFSCPRSIPHPKIWPHHPLLVRDSSVHFGWDPKSEAAPISINGQVHEFETELFKGKMIFRVRGQEGTEAYFAGRNRLSSVIVTGKFKKTLLFSEVQTGQEFCKPVKQPPQFISRPLIKFFRLLSPLLQVYVGEQSYLLSPLAQTAQTIHVSDEPLEMSPDMDLEENWSFVELGQAMNFNKRKKHFSSKSALSQHSFKTDKYYSFDFYNDKLDMAAFKLRALGQEFDVQKYLKGQPLRVLSRVFKPGDPNALYLWNFEIWHAGAVSFFQ